MVCYSPQWGSNSRPLVYKTSALTTELWRLTYGNSCPVLFINWRIIQIFNLWLTLIFLFVFLFIEYSTQVRINHYIVRDESIHEKKSSFPFIFFISQTSRIIQNLLQKWRMCRHMRLLPHFPTKTCHPQNRHLQQRSSRRYMKFRPWSYRDMSNNFRKITIHFLNR